MFYSNIFLQYCIFLWQIYKNTFWFANESFKDINFCFLTNTEKICFVMHLFPENNRERINLVTIPRMQQFQLIMWIFPPKYDTQRQSKDSHDFVYVISGQWCVKNITFWSGVQSNLIYTDTKQTLLITNKNHSWSVTFRRRNGSYLFWMFPIFLILFPCLIYINNILCSHPLLKFLIFNWWFFY